MFKLKTNYYLSILLSLVVLPFLSCNPLGKKSVDDSDTLCIGISSNPNCDNTSGAGENASLTIEQDPSQADPTSNPNITFIATFSRPIDPDTFTPADVLQLGTATVTWSVSDNGESTAFTITAMAISGGTAVPFVVQGSVNTADGAVNETSTSADNSVTFDNGINPPSNIMHATTEISTNDSPPTSWTVSPDLDVSDYQLAIGTTGMGMGENDLIDWTSIGLASSHPGFTSIAGILQCTPYYTSVRAIDSAGNISAAATTPNPFTVDAFEPSMVTMLMLNNTFAKTNQSPSFTWSASTDNCAFDQYEFAIGTTGTGMGLDDIMPWTEIGNILAFAANSPADAVFTLSHGTDHYASVRAKDQVGNVSAATTSLPWQLNYNYAQFSSNATSSGTNINTGSSTELLWSPEVVDDSIFGFSGASAQDITLLQSGNYLAQLILPTSSSVQRPNIRVDFYLDGALVQGGRAQSAYTRNTNSHTESSNNVNVLIPAVTANQVLTAEVMQLAASGTVNINEQVTLVLSKLQDSDESMSALATTTSAGSNFNLATPSAIEWNRSADELFDSSTYTHATGSSSIAFDESGDYLLYFNFPFNDPNGNQNTRVSVRGEIKINGSVVGYARQGYMRRASGHNESSIHWAGLLRNISPSDILTIELAGDTTITQAVNISVGQSASLFLTKMSGVQAIDLSGSTLNNGSFGQTNLNQAGVLEWTTQHSSSPSIFSHDPAMDPETLTIAEAGDYYFAFNVSLFSTIQRPNPKFELLVNGSAVDGLECKSNYIRSIESHNDSSCSMVSLLHDLSTGDTISIRSSVEAALSTVTASVPFNLYVWKRP